MPFVRYTLIACNSRRLNSQTVKTLWLWMGATTDFTIFLARVRAGDYFPIRVFT